MTTEAEEREEQVEAEVPTITMRTLARWFEDAETMLALARKHFLHGRYEEAYDLLATSLSELLKVGDVIEKNLLP